MIGLRINKLSFFFLLVLSLPVSVGKTYAQSYYGTLKGSVTDVQGGAIANADVVLTDVATKVGRTAKTNDSGEYVFGAVDPGIFNLTVNSPGFSVYQQKNVNVATQQTVAIDVKLSVGEASTVVEVTSGEPLIDTSTASNGQIFDAQRLVDLPNLGRNPFLLSKLNNNVTATGDPRFNRFQDQSGSSAISIAGGPINGNNYEIDGVPITDFSNRAVIIPSVEAVQEMKTQANTYDAEMGRTGGGVFNTLLKSGSNALHGNLYGSTRQSNWAANTWQNNFNGTPRGNSTQYSYEGAIGGPVVIPHLYNGRNKTFFEFTEEGYRQRSPLGASYYIPSDAERAGNFSGRVKVYDPATGAACTANNTTLDATGKPVFCRYEFGYGPGGAPGANGGPAPTGAPVDVIPTNRISAVGTALLQGLPHCGAGCTGTSVAYGATNYRPTDLLGDRADEFISKVDHQMRSWWLANASYLHYGSKEPGGNPLGTAAGASSSYLLYRKVDAFNQNNTFTLNPTTVATVSFGFNRFPNNTVDLSNGFDQSTLGFPASYTSTLQKKAFPEIIMSTGNTPQFGTNNSGPAVFYSRNFVVGVQKSVGKQILKAGYVFRSISVDFTNIGVSNGQFTFNNTFTTLNPNAKSGGADLADLLLGYPTAGQVQIVTPLALNVKYNALYLQDDWRIKPKLTLSFGLRYESEPGIHERNNHYAVGFDRNVTNPISTTSGVPTKGGIEFAGQNGYPTQCCNNGSTKFTPRLGFNYALTPKTVIRGGYGVFYAPIYYSTSPSLAPGYVATNNYIASNDSNQTPANSLSNPYPGLQQPSGNSLGYLQGVGSSLTTIDQDRRSPVVQQFSFDIERELPYGVAFQIGYVGSKGRNLLPGNGVTYNIDEVNLAAVPYGVGACPANPGGLSTAAFLTGKSANPYAGKGGSGSIGAATITNAQLCKPFPQFTSVAVQPSSSKSLYNSMIMKAQKNFSHGLSLVTSFTWSQNWDSSFGQTSNLNVGAATGPQDVYNINGSGGEYARAINDIPLRYTLGGSYELPFGKGRPFLSNNRWIDLAVGGWSMNMIMVNQTGAPVPIQQDQNNNGNAGFGNAVQRPNIVAIGNVCTSGSVQQRLGTNSSNLYFNPAAFAPAAAGTYGNAPRTIGSCASPGYRNADISVFKDFTAERVHFRFQAEALNAFNTPEFAINTSGLKYGNAAFGTVNTSAINLPRYISLGGRISF